jgi:hypothetical protein
MSCTVLQNGERCFRVVSSFGENDRRPPVLDSRNYVMNDLRISQFIFDYKNSAIFS